MSSSFSTNSIRSILVLAERRDALVAEIEKIDLEFSRILNGGKPSNSAIGLLGHRTGNGLGRSKKATSKASKRGKRGAVQEMILAGFKEAGNTGIAVKQLAINLGMKPQNIHAWLHITGKKKGFVEALGNGVYRLEKSISADTSNRSIQAPKPVLRRKRTKRGPK